MIVHNPTMRVVDVLEVVASHNGELSLREISRATSILPGTLMPILRTLSATQFLQMDEQTKRYSIGLRTFLTGAPFVKSSDSYAGIKSILTDMTGQTGETTHFCTLHNGNVLYVSKVDSSQPIRMYSDIGKQLPAYGTAVGKALISEKSLDELRALYPDGLKPLTEHTIVDLDELYVQLLKVRKTGFAYECEESNTGIRCIATPIRMQGKIVAAISLVVPIYRYTEEKRQRYESILKSGACMIAELLPHLNLSTIS
jgi:DNA-binding IclR family transcriptional regulator